MCRQAGRKALPTGGERGLGLWTRCSPSRDDVQPGTVARGCPGDFPQLMAWLICSCCSQNFLIYVLTWLEALELGRACHCTVVMRPIKPPIEVTVKSRDVQLHNSLETKLLRIVHISDTHSGSYGGQLPDGDVLIHSGDFTNGGVEEPGSVAGFLHWFLQERHRYKILICGNHELLLDRRHDLDEYLACDTPEAAVQNGFQRPVLLNDSGVSIEGVIFYGSSWNHCRMAWSANEQERELYWARIPQDVDVLITHQPPLGILDLAWLSRGSGSYECAICGAGTQHKGNYAHWGCASLLQHVRSRNIPLHCFGHVHDEHGFVQIANGPNSSSAVTTYSNAAMDIYRTANVINYEYRATSTVGPAKAASPVAEPVGPFWMTTGTGQVVDIDADPSFRNQRVWLWKKLRPAANQLWYAMPCESASHFVVVSALSQSPLRVNPRCLYAVNHRILALTEAEAAMAARMEECRPVLLPEATVSAMQRGPALVTVGHLHVAVDHRTSELILQVEDAVRVKLELC